MAYVTVPKDLTKVKAKFILNLTKRQAICFGCGALIGVPLFFLLKPHIPTSAAVIVMVVTMLPFFLFAMYERNGQPLEKMLSHFVQARFVRSKERVYQTNNFYAALMRQALLDKEVRAIVKRERR